MKNFAFVLMLSFALVAARSGLAETTVETGIPGGGASDLLGKTKIDTGEASSDSKPNIRLTSECVDGSGNRYSPSDSGYGACMRSSGGKGSNPNPEPSKTVGVKFGK